jgi:hypothetical protein
MSKNKKNQISKEMKGAKGLQIFETKALKLELNEEPPVLGPSLAPFNFFDKETLHSYLPDSVRESSAFPDAHEEEEEAKSSFFGCFYAHNPIPVLKTSGFLQGKEKSPFNSKISSPTSLDGNIKCLKSPLKKKSLGMKKLMTLHDDQIKLKDGEIQKLREEVSQLRGLLANGSSEQVSWLQKELPKRDQEMVDLKRQVRKLSPKE